MTMEKGKKDDDGKPRFDLLPPDALREVAKVYSFGATKYAAHNWRKGIEYSRLFAAAQRHLWSFYGGEDFDSESGMQHLAHAAFNVLALLQFQLENSNIKNLFDDRFILNHATGKKGVETVD